MLKSARMSSGILRCLLSSKEPIRSESQNAKKQSTKTSTGWSVKLIITGRLAPLKWVPTSCLRIFRLFIRPAAQRFRSNFVSDYPKDDILGRSIRILRRFGCEIKNG
jgi:hypothetical protein